MIRGILCCMLLSGSLAAIAESDYTVLAVIEETDPDPGFYLVGAQIEINEGTRFLELNGYFDVGGNSGRGGVPTYGTCFISEYEPGTPGLFCHTSFAGAVIVIDLSLETLSGSVSLIGETFEPELLGSIRITDSY